jgi:DNA-binding NarL/FixJ family response regulator
MTAVLICSHAEDLKADLGGTLLWRNDVERQVATKMEEVLMLAVAARPRIVVIDRDLPWAARILSALREDPTTRGLSLVVMARGDFDAAEVELLECGANAILRLPAGPEWNQRLERLMDVPVRKETRFPVSFAVEASNGGGGANAQALNLSASGMLIETEIALNVLDEVQLQFGLPVAIETVRIAGQVVRQAAPSQFGVEFRGIGAKESRQIQGYLASLGA